MQPFQSTPSVGRATRTILDLSAHASAFQSTPSVGRATEARYLIQAYISFQSTPSVGRATLSLWGEAAHFLYFNPRPPWGGRQKNSGLSRQAGFHFNPRPPWGGRPLRQLGKLCRLRISIHALRGEGDPRRHFDRHAAVDGISIHALRGEGDDNNIVLHGVITISIHALRGEGDNQKHALTMMFDEFQSTPSVGRATKFGGHRQGKHGISIHALRGEGDEKAYTLTAGYGDFNPRPPWGGRRIAKRTKYLNK